MASQKIPALRLRLQLFRISAQYLRRVFLRIDRERNKMNVRSSRSGFCNSLIRVLMIGQGPGQVVKMKSAIQILSGQLCGAKRLGLLIHELELRQRP